MSAELFAPDGINSGRAPSPALGERIKPADLREFLAELEPGLKTLFVTGEPLQKATQVRKIIIGILGLELGPRDKITDVVFHRQILVDQKAIWQNREVFYLTQDQARAYGTIYFVADRKYPEINAQTIENWIPVFQTAKTELLDCGLPAIAKLIHIPEEKKFTVRRSTRPIEMTETEVKGYHPNERTLQKAAKYDCEKIQELIAKTAGKDFDSLETLGRDQDDIDTLVIQMFYSFCSHLHPEKKMDLNEEFIDGLQVRKYRKILSWCGSTMEKNFIPNLAKLYERLRIFIEKNPKN